MSERAQGVPGQVRAQWDWGLGETRMARVMGTPSKHEGLGLGMWEPGLEREGNCSLGMGLGSLYAQVVWSAKGGEKQHVPMMGLRGERLSVYLPPHNLQLPLTLRCVPHCLTPFWGSRHWP